MQLENQVVSLELAKKLKGLGVRQESYFYWVDSGWRNKGFFVIARDGWACDCDFEPGSGHGCDLQELAEAEEDDAKIGPGEIVGGYAYSAFTVAELGEMLPMDRVCTNKNTKFAIWFDSAIPPTESIITGQTEADARAKMLIYLIEKKIVKPKGRKG